MKETSEKINANQPVLNNHTVAEFLEGPTKVIDEITSYRWLPMLKRTSGWTWWKSLSPYICNYEIARGRRTWWFWQWTNGVPEEAEDEAEVELIDWNGYEFEKNVTKEKPENSEKAKEAETNLTDQHKIIEQKEKEHYNQ